MRVSATYARVRTTAVAVSETRRADEWSGWALLLHLLLRMHVGVPHLSAVGVPFRRNDESTINFRRYK